MFLAAVSGGAQIPSNPIVFDYSFINHGNHYDNTTGIYTVPIDGIYEFYVHNLLLAGYRLLAVGHY